MHTSDTTPATVTVRPVMNREETADYLRISVRQLSNLVKERQLKPAYIGRTPVFKKTELDRWLDLLMAQAA